MKTILWALGLIVLIAVMIAGSYTFYRYQVFDAVLARFDEFEKNYQQANQQNPESVGNTLRQRLLSAADQAYKNDQQANQQNPESVGNKSLQTALAKFDEFNKNYQQEEALARLDTLIELNALHMVMRDTGTKILMFDDVAKNYQQLSEAITTLKASPPLDYSRLHCVLFDIGGNAGICRCYSPDSDSLAEYFDLDLRYVPVGICRRKYGREDFRADLALLDSWKVLFDRAEREREAYFDRIEREHGMIKKKGAEGN